MADGGQWKGVQLALPSPPTTGMEAGHRASRSNRILINRTHPKAMTTTVVLAPKQHRKPGCGRREGSKQVGGGQESGLEGTGCIHLRGEHCALAQGGGGGVGQCTEVPTFSCYPQHPGDTGLWADLPFIAAHQHETPPAPTLAPQVDPRQGEGKERENCLEKDSTRIQ